jgi:thioredoxin 1
MIEEANSATFSEIKSKNGINVVDFWAPWCGPCRMMLKHIEPLAKESGANFYKVNIDNNEELTKELSIRSVPTLMIYKDGILEKTHVGALSQQAVKELIDSI